VGRGAVEVEVVQDGVDVEEQEHDVAGVPGVEGEPGGPVVAAGLADQAHGVHLRGVRGHPAAAHRGFPPTCSDGVSHFPTSDSLVKELVALCNESATTY
jgi:hypothetical protein